MTPQELKQLSDSAFPDNTEFAITPARHREFNNALIDSIPFGGGGASGYTFVVESQADLDKWRTDPSGDLYYSVLIKRGLYTLSGNGIDLAASGTYRIVAEPGSYLSSTSASYMFSGAGYSEEERRKLVIAGINAGAEGYTNKGIGYCANIHLCSLTGFQTAYEHCEELHTSSGDFYTTDDGTPFYTVYNNCTGVYGSRGRGHTESHASGSVFFECDNVHRCFAEAQSSDSGATPYSQSTRISHCDARCLGSDGGSSACYSSCDLVSNSYGWSRGTNGSTGMVYLRCKRVSFNNGVAITEYSGDGDSNTYYDCTDIHCCTGSASGGENNFTFRSCRVMFGNDAPSGYSACYMTLTGTTAPVANTAAGGWNR